MSVIPDFLLAPLLGRQAPMCSSVWCFVVFGNKGCPILSLQCSLWLCFGNGVCLEAGLGADLAVATLSCLNPAPPALHIAQLLTQVELCLKLLHSFTYLLWKGLRRGWENEFGMEYGGKLKASAATVVYFLSFIETRAMYNQGNNVNSAAVTRTWF